MNFQGLPLLSGPPPPLVSTSGSRVDIGCRKCGKEFNVLFSRSRKCNHCGFFYCHNCSDFSALMPRTGGDSGYDAVPVCGHCVEFLTLTASGRAQLKQVPLAKLKKYVSAYNIPVNGAVEKDDVVNTIIAARGPNGCLPPAKEQYYRTYSVPDRFDYSRPRGLFARGGPGPNTPPAPPPPRPNTTHPNEFARPDLTPDSPPPPHAQSHPRTTAYAPPPTNSPRPRPYTPREPPRPTYSAHPNRPSNPPPRPSRPRSNPTPAPTTNASSRPRTTSTTPPPTLNDLLSMDPDSIRALGVGALKEILFRNHVNATNILEKSELVSRVNELVQNERNERARQREAEEAEEAERIALQHQMMEEKRRRDEAAAAAASGGATLDSGEASGAGTSTNAPAPPAPSQSPKSMARAERQGLCVICQDEEANIAIVDCGHLAMCRGCSELVMSSSRECPLCRTRIVTEQRLLRIFKT